MKEIVTQEQIQNIISDEKKIEIKLAIEQHWNDFYTATELANYVDLGYIFGLFGYNEHYMIDDIMMLIQEVQLEKNPPVIEPVIEEEDAGE